MLGCNTTRPGRCSNHVNVVIEEVCEGRAWMGGRVQANFAETDVTLVSINVLYYPAGNLGHLTITATSTRPSHTFTTLDPRSPFALLHTPNHGIGPASAAAKGEPLIHTYIHM